MGPSPMSVPCFGVLCPGTLSSSEPKRNTRLKSWAHQGSTHFPHSEGPQSRLAGSKLAVTLDIFSGTHDTAPREAGGPEL